MIISDEKKFVFCHVPKTAGISIASALKEWSSNEKWRVGDSLGLAPQLSAGSSSLSAHATMEELYSYTSTLFKGYYKFGVVRNSWERLVSFYHYSGEIKNRTFADFIHRTCTGKPAGNINRIRPQKSYLFGKDGKCLVDKICRFERLEKDFLEVCAAIKVGKVTLQKKNTTIHNSYEKYYIDQPHLIEKVFTTYYEDIKYFGFVFGA